MSYNYLSHDEVCYDISQLTKEPTVNDRNNNRFKQVEFGGFDMEFVYIAHRQYGIWKDLPMEFMREQVEKKSR